MTSIKTHRLTRDMLNREIDRIFDFVGMPPHLSGYRYLHNAIVIAYDEPERMRYIIRDVYAKVAEMCGTTTERVERSGRTALSFVSVARIDEMLNRRCLRQTITMKGFITLLVNYLRYFEPSSAIDYVK